MQRNIIEIDETLCNGCGLCIPNCHEGALQIIDGKARLISDLFCDGLGACIGYCPEGAIQIIEREAEPYDEWKVMETIVPKGRNTILAHLDHLRDHNETVFLNEAIRFLKENNIDMSPEKAEKGSLKTSGKETFSSLSEARQNVQSAGCGGGCPGALPVDFQIDKEQVEQAAVQEDIGINVPSELRQWPVQLHLLNPQASCFRNADVILAADCVAFAMGNFHARFLKGKSLAIACPKLDTNKESYVQKLTSMIADAGIRSLTVVMMEVPCCGGLLGMAQNAMEQAGRNIPVKKVIVGIRGEVLTEEII
jgi:ferredoxin